MSISSLSTNSRPQTRLTGEPSIKTIREQVESDNITQISATSVDDLPRIRIGDKSYILAAYLATKRTRPRRSWVWDHGTAIMEIPSKTTYWACNHCDKARRSTLFNAQTSSNGRRHLESDHGIYKPRDKGESSSDDDCQDTQGKVDMMFS